mgnify:CR=1 FL=1
MVKVYNKKYNGRFFNNQEDAIRKTFSDAYEAFICGTESEGYFSSDDEWFEVNCDNMLYSYDDISMLDKIRDDMCCDIYHLSKDIEDDKVDQDGLYREIVKDITLAQRHYKKTLENVNTELFKYIDENTERGYGIDDLKEILVGFQEKCKTSEYVLETNKLVELIEQRNAKVKELLNNNSLFLKGALYNKVIECNARYLGEISTLTYSYYGINNEFIDDHAESFDEVNLNLAKIGEFII